MAIFWDAPVSPDALTMFVREVPVDTEQLGLLASFPVRNVDDNTIDFAEIVKRNRTAKYRAFDGSIHVSERDSGSTSRVKLLPLSTSLNESEYERLQREFARTGGTFTAAMEQAIYNDAENLTRYVQNRLELAWGDVLTDGKLTITENGLVGFEADFGVPANHKVTAAAAWTTASTTVLTDMRNYWDVFVATNGNVDPSLYEWQVSLSILRGLQGNTQLINAIKGSASGATFVTTAEINNLLDSQGLPTLAPKTYDGVLDVDGVDTRPIAADRAILLPKNRGSLGYTAFGVSATALELVGSSQSDLDFSEAAGIVGIVEKVGPPYRKFTFVDAVAMPVLENAKRIFIADVA